MANDTDYMSKEPLVALVGGIQKFSIEDGPGIRTTVFLKGCPLNCKWCHNPELIDFRQQIIVMLNSCIKCGYCIESCPQDAIRFDDEGTISINRVLCDNCMKCTEVCYAKALRPVANYMSVGEVLEEVEQDRDFYLHTDGGLTISGGEVLSHPDFAEDLIKKCAEKEINVCIDTSGYGDGYLLERLLSYNNVTNVLFDMKSIDNDIHKEYTGVENGLILDNLEQLANNPAILPALTMRMPLIKDVNDSDEIIHKTAAYYKEHNIKNVTLLPYHNLGISKEKNIGGCQAEFETPGRERIESILEQFVEGSGMNGEILGGL
jgi:pyruvate formate lyase activating enzyme